LVKQTLAVRKTSSYTGPAKQAHGEVEAERMLAAGLRILGVEAGELAELPKGMPEKRVLAWWLRQRPWGDSGSGSDWACATSRGFRNQSSL